MIFSYTGLIYLFGSFSMGFLTYRFLTYWQKEKDFISFNFLIVGIIITTAFLITAIGSLFFPLNQFFLQVVVVVSSFLQGLACAFLGKTFIDLKFPKFSSWIGFLIIFILALAATVMGIIYPFAPYLENNNWINWNIQPISGAFRLFYFFLGMLPIGIFMLKEGFSFKEKELKIKSIGLGVIFFSVFLWAPLVFIFRNYLPNTLGEDFILLPVFVIIFIVTFLTQKSSSSIYNKVRNKGLIL